VERASVIESAECMVLWVRKVDCGERSVCRRIGGPAGFCAERLTPLRNHTWTT